MCSRSRLVWNLRSNSIFLLINCFLSVSWQFNRCNRMKVCVHTKQWIVAAGMYEYFVIVIEVSCFMMPLCLCSLWPWNCLKSFSIEMTALNQYTDGSQRPPQLMFCNHLLLLLLGAGINCVDVIQLPRFWYSFLNWKATHPVSYLVIWNCSRIGTCHIFNQLIFLLNVTENRKDFLSWQFCQCFILIAGLQSTDCFRVRNNFCLIDKVDSHKVILF